MQRTCRELATNLCKELSHKRNLKRRIPFFDATSVTNVKNNRKLPRTFRNLDLEIALLQFAVLQNASSCNKRMPQNAELQNWGAAMLAPHGAFGSAAPLWGSNTACQIKLRILQISEFSDSKSLYGPTLRRRPCPKTPVPLAIRRRDHNFCDLLPTFWLIENPFKIGPLKKSSKIAKMKTQARPKLDFGVIVAPCSLHFRCLFAKRQFYENMHIP